MDQTDLYLARARGALDSIAPMYSIVNPDLPFDDVEVLKPLREACEKENVPLLKFSPLIILLAWPLLANYATFTSDGEVVDGGMAVIIAFMFSIVAALLFGVFNILGARAITSYRLNHSPQVKSVHSKGHGRYWWHDAPASYTRPHRMFLSSVATLRTCNLDVETSLTLQDLERQEHLLLRELKHSKDAAEEAALMDRLENLTLQTAALSYAWQDRRASEKAQLEQALVEETIDVTALVRQVVEDSPATNSILKPVEETHHERA